MNVFRAAHIRALATFSVAAVVATLAGASGGAPRFEEAVAARRAVERVYWSHRLWPVENPGPRPAIEQVSPLTQTEATVLDGIRKVNALSSVFGRSIDAREVQRELNRIAGSTKLPDRLREIWAALGDDPTRFGETIARPLLADRLLRGYVASRGAPFDAWWSKVSPTISTNLPPPLEGLSKPAIAASSCSPGTWSPMLQDSPSARAYHVAVWTGSEMIVWGGADPISGWQVSGSRYDPTTDSWHAMAIAGAPAPRGFSSGFWTGTEMLIVGGYNNTIDFAFPANARYNPVTDTWTSASAPAGETARDGASIVWTGTGVIVWGGANYETSVPLQTGLRYNLATDSWSPTATSGAPVARRDHAAVWTGSLMIVWGGDLWDGSGLSTDTGGRYDPATNTWSSTRTPGSPAARHHASVVWTGSKMIVWAGFGTDSNGSDEFNDGARYDPATDHWSLMSSQGAPGTRSGAPAVWTGTTMIVWGGNSQLSGTSMGAGGGKYVEASNSWAPMSAVGSPGDRTYHTMIWTGSQAIVWGGYDGTSYSDTGARYDPTANTWTPAGISNRPLRRSEYASVWTGSEMLVWGGHFNSTGTGDGGRYDPSLDAWTHLSRTNEPPNGNRTSYTAVWTGTEMIVWGGLNQDEVAPPLGSGGRYLLASDTWIAVPPNPALEPRWGHVAVWTGHEMLVWGGRDYPSNTFYGNGARFDPATSSWTPIATAGAPTARYQTGAAWTGREMIVWGGTNFVDGFRTGGRYSPTSNTWSDTTPNLSLERRYDHDTVWTGREMIVYDGSVYGSPQYPGWVFNPRDGSWRSMNTNGAPASTQPVPRSAEWSCDRMYSIGSGPDPNASYDPATGGWSPVPKGTLTGYVSKSDVLAAGSRLIDWNGVAGEVYCACAEIPAAAPKVFLYSGDAFNRNRMDWMVDPAASSYDVVRGDLEILRTTGGNFTASSGTCLANDLDDTWRIDSDPVLASGFWYLVRGKLGTSAGSYDSGSADQIGSRDAGIAASIGACP